MLRPQPSLAAVARGRLVEGKVTADGRIDLDTAHVVLECESERWLAAIAPSGGYRFDDVPAGRVLQCYLEVGGVRYTSERGKAVVTTCDQWGWNFHIP